MTAGAVSTHDGGIAPRATRARAPLPQVQETVALLSRLRLLRAILVGAGGALAVWIVLTLAATGVPTGALVRAMAAALCGVLTGTLALRRMPSADPVRAALWIEERTPTGYAAVVHTEDAVAQGGGALAVETRAMLAGAASDAMQEGAATLTESRRRLVRHMLSGPALFAGGALAVALLAPLAAREGVNASAPRTGGGSRPGETRAAAPVGRWRVRVLPPSYTGRPAHDAGDADGIRAIEGSRVEITGEGEPPTVIVRAVGASADSGGRQYAASVRRAGDDWSATLAVPALSLETRVTRGGSTRLLLVEAVRDSIPRVTLRAPVRDSVLRTPSGKLPLQALVHDDLGIGTGAFELIVSSGEGERFTARTVTVGASSLGGRAEATLGATLDIDALKLAPGDVVHLRAVARDRNPAPGRESGSSETRSFRIARQSEYDSVAVEPAAPPPVDSSMISQRMLLLLTERLDRRRPRIDRETLVRESRGLARDQARLRLAVGNVVFQRLTGEQGAEHAHFEGDGHEHLVEQNAGKLTLPGRTTGGVLDEGDDSPIIAINRPLLEAYNAMWDAGRALEQADPRGAIPHMRLALAAIERARSAERLYLRGKPPTVIIDLAKVRLTGKDTGATNLRSSRDPLPPSDAARERRLLAAASLLVRDPGAARDSLALLRLDALGHAPVFTDALGALLEALREGGDVTGPFLRARRALGGVERVPGVGWSRGGTP